MEARLKRIISLILALTLFLLSSGCKKQVPPDNVPDDNNGENTGNSGTSTAETIVVPTYKDYGRSTVDFDKLVYSRPELTDAIAAFDACAELVKADELSFDKQVENIVALEKIYSNVDTMYTLAQIYARKDTSVTFWQEEYLHLSTGYPAFAKSVEDLLVACALSEHKSAFEEEYFGYSLDEYTDGGDYTDELVALLEQEAMKEAEYSSFSTATVTITYSSLGSFSFSGTVDEVFKQAEEKFGKDSTQYKNATVVINELYRQKVKELSTPIYVDLIKIRRLIADELGLSSYVDYAYENRDYDYSPADMQQLLKSIGAYVAPVAERLNSVTFTSYFQKNNQPRLSEVEMINALYSVYSGAGSELSDAYSYMLQHKLYDIAPSQQNRYNGAFTAYVEDNNSPFVFMSSTGFMQDYTTLSHEFGHFYDGYVNYGNSASLTLSEVSSQGLEYLTVLRLRSKLKMVDYEYLEYLSMYSTLNTVLLEQSFYAAFEHKAYALDYDKISAKNLNQIANEAFYDIYGQELQAGTNLLQHLIIPHTILSPCYVESYVSSAIPALEIFFLESYRTGESGKGLEAYNTIVHRSSFDVTFIDKLQEAGLSDPFKPETVKSIANLIHYQILGKDYFTETDVLINVA